MIIYLYGPDSYRRREKLNEYLERYKEKYASGAGNFYLDDEGDFEKLKDFCKAQSLFESSKLGIIYNFSGLVKNEEKDFISLIKNNLDNKDTMFILIDEKKPLKAFGFLLEKPAIAHEFDYLGGVNLKRFLDSEIKKRDMELDDESKNLLLSVYGQDTWGLVSELDKLSLLNEKKITRKILEKHVDISPAVDVFYYLNKIRVSSGVGAKLALLEELFSANKDSAMIFNMAAASPYLDKMQKIKMADYDAAVKSGKLEYDEVLLSIVLESRS